MLLPAEVEPRRVLEHQAALLPVALPPDGDEGCHEAKDLEVTAQLRGVPDLPVRGFQVLPVAGLGVDVGEGVTSD